MRQNRGRGHKEGEDGRNELVSVQGLKWEKIPLLSHLMLTEELKESTRAEGAYFTCEEYLLKAHVIFSLSGTEFPRKLGTPCPCLGSTASPFPFLGGMETFALLRDLSLKGSLQLKEELGRLFSFSTLPLQWH